MKAIFTGSMYKKMPKAVTILIILVLGVLVEHGVEFFSKVEGKDIWAVVKAFAVSFLMECFGAIGLYVGFNRLTRRALTRIAFLVGSIVCLSTSFFIQWSYYDTKVEYSWIYAGLLPAIVAIASAGVSALESEIAEDEKSQAENQNTAIELKRVQGEVMQLQNEKKQLESEKAQLQDGKTQLEAEKVQLQLQLQNANSETLQLQGAIAEGNYIPVTKYQNDLNAARVQLQLVGEKAKQLESVAQKCSQLEDAIARGELINLNKFRYSITELKEQLQTTEQERDELNRLLAEREKEVKQLQEHQQKLLTAGVQLQELKPATEPLTKEAIEELRQRFENGELSVEQVIILGGTQLKASTVLSWKNRAGKQRSGRD